MEDINPTKWIRYTQSDVQQACGQSRLCGGMHFSKAIPVGEQLCSGVAALVVNRAELLKQGDANGALADIDDTSIIVKKCKNNGKKDLPY